MIIQTLVKLVLIGILMFFVKGFCERCMDSTSYQMSTYENEEREEQRQKNRPH